MVFTTKRYYIVDILVVFEYCCSSLNKVLKGTLLALRQTEIGETLDYIPIIQVGLSWVTIQK